jgi:predicted AlkP superfamily pyrophosphatase or phosphodiesterase
METSTIVILLDALGFTLARKHGFEPASLPARARLKTVLGFSQAALASIFTGLTPDRHGLWMMYSFARGRSPFSWLRLVPGRVSARRLWLRRAIRWHLAHVARVNGYYSLYDIPREILRHLDISARGDIFAPGGAGGVPTIFDRLAERGVPRLVWDYRTEEGRAFDELEEAVRGREGSFYLLYTAGLDSDLHRFGTEAPRIGERLARYEERIRRIVAAAAPGDRIVVLGDHGMRDVRASIDLMGEVEELGLDVPGDFVPFYDSTMARFKIVSPRARAAVEKLLGDHRSGRLLSGDEMRRLGVAFPDGRFGDLVFLVEPGILILPSHMGTERVAAMHGYHPDVEEMSSIMLSNLELPAAEMSVTEAAGVICPAAGGGGTP